MKTKTDFKKIDATELARLLTEKRTALKSFLLGTSGSKVRNVKEGGILRKDIARILTALGRATE
ncbi:MAG: hypothetical protein WC757_03265 [Candidatus Paceibacterota bacterium]|jgi:ribosomal protein L29